jgi:hypothetical protein
VEETIELQIAELSRMTVGQLKQKYIEVFGEETRSNNRQFLFRRIAWRIQALAEGGLSERARHRALDIANDADNLPAEEHAENLDVILRPALTDARQAAVLAAKNACLEIAEDEAERCRGVGATTAQQTALNIAARIRKRHVEVIT